MTEGLWLKLAKSFRSYSVLQMLEGAAEGRITATACL